MTSAHDSLDTRIFQKECRSLADAGYEVVLLAQHEQPEEEVEGVKIRGIEAPENRWQRMTRTTLRLFRDARREEGEIYHFHDPELIPVALSLKVAGHKVVWDVHEDIPKQVMHKEWIPRLLRRPVSVMFRLVESVLRWTFDGIVAATPSIGEAYTGQRVVVVNNYPRLSHLPISRCDADDTGDRADDAVVYTGSITRIRGIRQMLSAIYRVADEIGVRLAMAGRFSPPELREEIGGHPGWSHVDFHGWLELEDMFRLLHRGRAGLLLFQPAPNHFESQPNKLFEYMAAGLPIIASDFPLWRELIVEDLDCGMVVDPTSADEIAAAVRWIFRNPSEARKMGRRGRQAVQERFNWRSEKEKLFALYEALRVQVAR